MKKYILYIAAFFPMFAFAQNSQYIISGNIEDIKSPSTVYCYVNNDVDSITTRNGSFKFLGTIPTATLVTIRVKYNNSQQSVEQIPVYVVGGDISLQWKYPLQPYTLVIKGPQETIDYTDKLTNPVLKTNEEIDRIDEQLATARTAKSQDTTAIKAKRKITVAKGYSISRTFIQTHPNSYVSFIALQMMGIGEIANPNRLSDLKTLYAGLSPELRNSEDGKSYQQFLDNLK